MSEETPRKGRTGKGIVGQVAGIITERELAINIGSEDGVSTGMKFQVLAQTPTDVADPNTGEVLGSIHREKVRVIATEVHSKFAVCKTYRTRVIEGKGIGVDWSSLFRSGSTPTREIPETLKADDSDYLEDLSEEESFVKKGDQVVQLIGDDD
jgi:hypothetical protein